MKTYFLIIGASLVLTLGVVCFVSYRMSKPDSAVKQKSAHQVQKQKVEKVIINKTLSPASVKTMAGPVSATARADRKLAAQNPNRKSLIANKQTKSPLERFEGKRIANAQEIPERILNQQSQSKPLSNAEIAAGPAGVEGSDIKVWTQGQDTGNFSSITGNKAFTVPPGTQVRIIGATLDGHSRPGRRQTITEPNKPLNVGLSSRLPDELFKEKPFQERNVRNPVCRLISIMALLAE